MTVDLLSSDIIMLDVEIVLLPEMRLDDGRFLCSGVALLVIVMFRTLVLYNVDVTVDLQSDN